MWFHCRIVKLENIVFRDEYNNNGLLLVTSFAMTGFLGLPARDSLQFIQK